MIGKPRTIANALLLTLIAWIGAEAQAQNVIYVDRDAVGANDGTSWADAYVDLQTAVSFATDRSHGVAEIWVAAGTYPPGGAGQGPSATFHLINGVSLYGGFAGGETTREERDPAANPAILSGDINGDDSFGVGTSDCCADHGAPGCSNAACEAAVCAVDPFCCDSTWDEACAARTVCLCGNLCSNRCDNSVHVVTGVGTDPSARLDGFTITGGHAFGEQPVQRRGGGLYADGGGATVVNCVFQGNRAADAGGAVYCSGFSQSLLASRCDFIANTAVKGGAVACDAAAPTFVNCRFLGNHASGEGGALRVMNGVPSLTNGLFSGNQAAGLGGGAVSVGGSGITLVHCTFSGNLAIPTGTGGGIRGVGSSLLLANCILWGNADTAGVGEASQLRSFSGTLQVTYSCIQGLTGAFGGVGNIGLNPLFLDSDGADDSPGTPDDNLRTADGSPCIDAANNSAVPADVTDLDGDGDVLEQTPRDLADRPRFIDDPFTGDTGAGTPPLADMGAYEHKSDCNENGVPDSIDISSQFSSDCDGNGLPDECQISTDSTAPGGPFFCTQPCDSDCNDNGTPDGCDIASGDSNDFDENNIPDECQPDCNGNGFPDFIDLLFGLSDDCNHNDIPDDCEPDCDADGTVDQCEILNCDGHPACADCNGNAVPDQCDIAAGAVDCNADLVPDVCEPDCNLNGRADDCDIADGASPDCNVNAVPDECDLAGGASVDCDRDSIPDECQPDCNDNNVNDLCDIESGAAEDCNNNNIPDSCDLASDPKSDCNGNAVLDACDIAGGAAADCQPNNRPDSCDIADGTSADVDANGVPDECDPDCNRNGLPDLLDVNSGTSDDCDGNQIPDECQPDCNQNQSADVCDIASGSSSDCQVNGVPDECETDCNGNQVPDDCDIDGGTVPDLNDNGIPDTCEPDCNGNGVPDFVDLAFHVSDDCNQNDVPDECDIEDGTTQDVNGNGVPDECDPRGDADGDGDVDLGDIAGFQRCFAPSAGDPPGEGCLFFYYDADADVDLVDFAALLQGITGP